MADITRTKGDIRPLPGAIIRRGTAGGTIEAGEAVYLDGSNDWKTADGDAGSSAELARGVAVAPEDIADGDVFDICVYGPVTGYSGATPGTLYYASDNAGEIAPVGDVTNAHIIGFAWSATEIFVNPQNDQ